MRGGKERWKNGGLATADQARDGRGERVEPKVTANRDRYTKLFVHAASPTSMAPDILDVHFKGNTPRT
jgi:hypothetical protein